MEPRAAAARKVTSSSRPVSPPAKVADIFQYNGGSLFQAMKPQDTLADLSDLPSQAGILDSFKKVVTSPDGHVRGTPFGPCHGWRHLYNRKILCRTRPYPRPRHGQSSWPMTTRSRQPERWPSRETLWHHLDLAALRPRRLLQRPGRGSKFCRRLHRQQAQICQYAEAATRGFEHLEEVAKAGLLSPDFGAAV